MRIKVKLRPMVAFFRCEDEPVRNVLKDVLTDEQMNLFEKKYPTLGALQEAERKDLIALTNAKVYEAIKEALSSYIEGLIIKSLNITQADFIPPFVKLAYGTLADDLELYAYSIIEIQDAIQKLSKPERRFVSMYYGLMGSKPNSETEIIKLIGNEVSVDDYKECVLKHIKENID